ncbi:MAG: SPFH domain-containing protein [Spirochaetes bacterium]|jgi:hypothetical protein|nr:SPFH domain-containing protein [Spirochaetota bacterium]
MFLIKFFKGQPSNFIIKFANGRIKKEGQGISFFYMKSRSTVVSIPINTKDANFIFNEMSKTFQAVAIQGQLTYRIIDPKKIFSSLDFSINPAAAQYISDDPEKLSQRIINAVQVAAREQVQSMSLEDVLGKSESISGNVLSKVKGDEKINALGVEVESLYFVSVTPIPEISKALEAEYRELLQKKADEAIYARRAAAVEQERIIKQNELDSEIEMSKRRKELVEIDGSNKLRESEFRSKSYELEWAPYRDLDPKIIIALGLKALGEGHGKIGNLNITPDLLSILLDERLPGKGKND